MLKRNDNQMIFVVIFFIINSILLVNTTNIKEINDGTVDDTCFEDCFYDSPQSCNNNNNNVVEANEANEELRPKCFNSSKCSNAVICCHLNDTNFGDYLNNNDSYTRKNITSLHILNSNITVFNLEMKNWLKTLTSLAITNGRMNEFNPVWKRMSQPKCLNLSSNGLNTIGNLSHVTSLKILDLSNNNLQNIPYFGTRLSSNTSSNASVTIDMSENQLSCNDLAKTLPVYNNKLDFLNPNNTWCMLKPKEKDWGVTTGRLMLAELEKLAHMNCSLLNCTCALHRVDNSNLMAGKLWITVDCSNRGLQKLPTPLPENCFSLNVSNNNISSLKPIHDSSYDSLFELYAENNNITSIDDLEGSKFIHNFSRLNLRFNNITSISTHPFRYAFDRASHRELSLGYNYIECDCNVAKNLKNWLIWNEIKDSEEVFCLGKNNVKVINLDPSELCREEPSLTDYIYYIIAIEALLLISLIAKVSYDYWVFKGTGYLPWPASKMPKLPCDWLCE